MRSGHREENNQVKHVYLIHDLVFEICEFHRAHAPDVHFVRCHWDGAIVEEEDMSIGSLSILWIHSRCDDCPATLCKCFHHRMVHL